MRTTHMRQHLLLVLPVLIGAGLLCPAPTGAADILDQSQTSSMSPANVNSAGQQAQIFTAGLYGYLDRVSLLLENFSSYPLPTGAVLTVSVQTVIGGLPSGKQIGRGTVSLSAMPDYQNHNWVDVNIRGALVAAGTRYALVLQTSAGTVNWWYAYTSYPGGGMAFNDGSTWRLVAGDNFAFKTYMVQDVLDQYSIANGSTEYLLGDRDEMAQIFTAASSGALDRVRLRLANFGNIGVAGYLDVSIQTMTGGYPSGIVIGQGSIPGSSISGGCLGCPQVWVDAAISGAVVSAGTQYAIVIKSVGGPGGTGYYEWSDYYGYSGGSLMTRTSTGWSNWSQSAAFETYIVPPVAYSPPPPLPTTNTPCSAGICPAAVGSVTPMDSPARVTSNVRFQELPDGAVRGILHFDDSKTGDFALKGCTTDSAACRLTVTRFVCTDQHAITIAGAYTPNGEATGSYQLTLSGARGEAGTFTLTASGYTYTVTHKGIVDVICPPATAGVASGKR